VLPICGLAPFREQQLPFRRVDRIAAGASSVGAVEQQEPIHE
jgi:hypothetical protein